jgi:hypothetical protein
MAYTLVVSWESFTLPMATATERARDPRGGLADEAGVFVEDEGIGAVGLSAHGRALGGASSLSRWGRLDTLALLARGVVIVLGVVGSSVLVFLVFLFDDAQVVIAVELEVVILWLQKVSRSRYIYSLYSHLLQEHRRRP